jgi:N-acetylglucosaminyl-diphospho-decaprenol L-rhamnosyltransferase
MTPRLSIVIVTYNSRNDIDACLASVSVPLPTVPLEIIVVDNASSDGTGDAIRARWPLVTIIDAGSNLGFARATNVGIRRSSGELVLLLNPDTRVSGGAIERLVTALDSDGRAAAAGPRLVDEHGGTELSFGRMVSPFNELRQKLLVVGHRRHVAMISTAVERMASQPRSVDWVSGACLLVRRADADAVGLLDERYFMYLEDVDFCAALRGRGRRILFVPGAEVVHRRGQSRRSAASATEEGYRRSQLAFYEKHHRCWAPWLRAYLRLKGRLPVKAARSAR